MCGKCAFNHFNLNYKREKNKVKRAFNALVLGVLTS